MKKFFLLLFISFSFNAYSQTFWQMQSGYLGPIQDFAFTSNGAIYAGVFSQAIDTIGGVYVSRDGGINWTRKNDGLTDRRIVEMASSHNNILFVGTEGGGLFRSEDAGDSWVQINNGLTNLKVYKVRFDVDGSIYVGTGGGGIHFSSDGGNTWTTRNTGLTNTNIHSFTITPQGNFIAGSYGGGIFKSTNKGMTWSSSNTGITNQQFWTLTSTSNVICAGSMHGMFRSTDEGNTWSEANNGMFNTGVVIVSDKNDNGDIFSILLGTGIYRSTNNGQLWTDCIGILQSALIECLGVSLDGYLYTCTNGHVYRSIESTTPVELVSFNADVSGRNVNLSWKTSSEINNKGFEVQKKISESFTTIEFINGSGSTLETKEYSFTDRELQPGVYTYRVKQVDYNGQCKIYPQIEVEVGNPDKYVLHQNYPNPFNPITVIKYSVASAENVKITVYDVLGKKINDLLNEHKSAGSYVLSFDGSSLPSGVYFYRIETGSYTETKKMVLLR